MQNKLDESDKSSEIISIMPNIDAHLLTNPIVAEVPSNKENSGYISKNRIGPDFQAEIPAFIPVNERKNDDLKELSTCMWTPSENITDEEYQKYISYAKNNHGFGEEQALGLLFTHKHQLENAYKDLGNYRYVSIEWTDEEKKIFNDGFLKFGKSFHIIQKDLPNKSTSEVVEYYYLWKKKRRNSMASKRMAKTKD